MKKYSLILSFWIFCLPLFAQPCQTEGNLIREVSVNAAGQPVITWNKPADLPANATGYILYDYLGVLPDCMTEIQTYTNFNDTVYTDTRNLPLTGTRAYCIAINTSLEPEPITQQHAFSFLKAEYDPCYYSVKMTWTPYVGWDTTMVTYKIYGGYGGTAELLGSTKDTTYTIADTPDNKLYKVYVVAVNGRDTSIQSYSNRVEVQTTTPQRPAFLTIDSIVYSGSVVNLSFSIDPATALTRFRIMRSSQYDGVFDTIHSFTDKSQNSYTDSNVESVFYYKLMVLNDCGKEARIKKNNMLNNIILSQQFTSGGWHLSWTPVSAPAPVYTLKRLQPNPAVLLTNSTSTSCNDPIDYTASDIRYCYRVEGIGTDSTKSITEHCADYEAEVLMPNAIDPLSTVYNSVTKRYRNQFGPEVYAADSMYRYILEIYGRNGDKIASIEKTESDSPQDKSWNGKLSNGNYAPEGMYIYKLKVTFTNGRTVTKTGSVSVVTQKI